MLQPLLILNEKLKEGEKKAAKCHLFLPVLFKLKIVFFLLLPAI